MSSWYDAWADRCAEWSTGVTADVPFYVGLACEADGLLVELAVGTGRTCDLSYFASRTFLPINIGGPYDAE